MGAEPADQDIDTRFIAVARYEQWAEAEIAAGALQAADFDAMTGPNVLAAMNFTYRHATGGHPVYVPACDAKAALEFIRKANPESAEALNWRAHPQALSGLPVALLAILEPLTGFVVADAIKRPYPRRVAVAVVLAILVLFPRAAGWVYWLSAWGLWLLGW